MKTVTLVDIAYRKELVTQQWDVSFFREIKENSPIVVYDNTRWKIQEIKNDVKGKNILIILRRVKFSQVIKDVEFEIKRSKIKESFLSQPSENRLNYLVTYKDTYDFYLCLSKRSYIIDESDDYYKILYKELQRPNRHVEEYILPEIILYFQCKIVKKELPIYTDDTKSRTVVPYSQLYGSFWEALCRFPNIIIEYVCYFDNDSNLFTFLIQTIVSEYEYLGSRDEVVHPLEDLHEMTIHFCKNDKEKEIINSVFFEAEVELTSLSIPDLYLYNNEKKNYVDLTSK